MNQEILDYIKRKRVCVLAVEMLDSSPHAATVHYANTENPLTLLFETNRDYRKSEALFGRKSTRASLVIGFDEGDMRTLQMDGEVRLRADAEKIIFEEVYLGKFPEKVAKSGGPDVVWFVFTPTWWRFTDWTKPEGKAITSSTDNQPQLSS